MTTHRIPLEALLTPDEKQAIDRFCADGRGSDFLPALALFLRERMRVEIALDADIVDGFAKDQSNLPGRAQGVARPSSPRECAVLLRACSRGRIPVTVSGGRSNLTGSATPEGGLVLSMVNMLSPVPQVDSATRTATASVGMILEDLRNDIVRQSGGTLMYPVDPTSRTDSSVGGMIACNASGFVPGERGATRDWVDSIDFLFLNGRLARARRGQYVSRDGIFLLDDGAQSVEVPVPRYARPRIKNAGGPYSAPDGVMDFIDWVVGSEGIYGIVTGCSVRLAPRPNATLDLFIPLPGEAEALTLFFFLREQFRGDFGSLSALEYFGTNCRRHMDHEEALFRGANEVAIYIQIPLADQAPEDAASEWLERIAAADCGVDEDMILLLDNDRDRKRFFEARHSLPSRTLEVVQHRGTFTIMTDTVVPPERFREYLDFTHTLLRAAGMDYTVFGHLGDCHLHFMLLPEKANLEQGAELYSRIVACAADLGGVYSGEHGTGKRKRKDFLRCYGPEGADQILRCKSAVDPALILNRGNVIESPQRLNPV